MATTSSPDPRPLTDNERQVLDALLGHDLANVDELRRQAETILAVSSCSCGCGSIGFVHQDGQRPSREVPARPASVEGTITSADGATVGGVLLFLRGDKLDDLEIYSVASEPLGFPAVHDVVWIKLTM